MSSGSTSPTSRATRSARRSCPPAGRPRRGSPRFAKWPRRRGSSCRWKAKARGGGRVERPVTIRDTRQAYAASTLCARIIGKRSPSTTMMGAATPVMDSGSTTWAGNGASAGASGVVVPVHAEQVQALCSIGIHGLQAFDRAAPMRCGSASSAKVGSAIWRWPKCCTARSYVAWSAMRVASFMFAPLLGAWHRPGCFRSRLCERETDAHRARRGRIFHRERVAADPVETFSAMRLRPRWARARSRRCLWRHRAFRFGFFDEDHLEAAASAARSRPISTSSYR